jgi:hypothetical protein
MKELFKNPFKTAILFITVVIIVIIGCVIFFKSCTHRVIYKGTVISHHTTSNRYGDISYYTVARFDDGNIRSIDGLEYYIIEVGGTVYYPITRLNK